MLHSTFNIGKLFSYKGCQSVLHATGTVYQLTCFAVKNILARPNKIWLQTWMNIELTKVLKFVGTKYTVNFDYIIFVDKSNYSTKLHFETLHFAKCQPQLNVDSQLLSLFLFNA